MAVTWNRRISVGPEIYLWVQKDSIGVNKLQSLIEICWKFEIYGYIKINLSKQKMIAQIAGLFDASFGDSNLVGRTTYELGQKS